MRAFETSDGDVLNVDHISMVRGKSFERDSKDQKRFQVCIHGKLFIYINESDKRLLSELLFKQETNLR